MYYIFDTENNMYIGETFLTKGKEFKTLDEVFNELYSIAEEIKTGLSYGETRSFRIFEEDNYVNDFYIICDVMTATV